MKAQFHRESSKMPNFGTERNQRAWEKLTPELQAKAEEIIARHRSPSYWAEEKQIREDSRRDRPP